MDEKDEKINYFSLNLHFIIVILNIFIKKIL